MPRFQGVPIESAPTQNRFGGVPVDDAPKMTDSERMDLFNQEFRLTPQATQPGADYLQSAPTFEGSGFLGGMPKGRDIKPELPQNIKDLPELNRSGLLSSSIGSAATLSPVLLATTDPEEIADIITSSVPEIQKVMERDQAGNVFPVLVNNKTGAATPINKPGLSGMDVLQMAGLGAAFTPAGRAGTVGGAMLKAGATETAIQGAQAATGGEFNPEDVVLSTATAGAFKGGEQFARLGRIDLLKPRNVRFIDEKTGLPTAQFQNSLNKYDLDVGAIADELDNLPVFSGNRTPDRIIDDIIIEKFERGDIPDGLYNKKVVARKIVNDPIGDEALRQGYLKGDIASAKSANAETKAQMREMLGMKRAIQAQSDRALDFRPTDVVGRNAMSGFNHIRRELLRLRNELDEVAEKELSSGKNMLEGPGTGGLLKGRQINTKIVGDQYIKRLDDLGVSVDSPPFPPKLDFTKSLISEDKTSQRVINSVTRILAKDKAPDAQAAHLLKRQLDTMLDFNKKSAAGLTDAGKKFAMQIRGSLNDSIREVSPRYAAVNDRISTGLRALERFDSALGGVDAFADNAPEAVGQTLRRLLSNAQSRTELNSALMDIDSVAREMGGDFPVNVKKLIMFNKTLDDRFGATARGSLQGDFESAMRSGPYEAVKDFAIKKTAETYKDLRGIDEKNAFNIMQQILSR